MTFSLGPLTLSALLRKVQLLLLGISCVNCWRYSDKQCSCTLQSQPHTHTLTLMIKTGNSFQNVGIRSAINMAYPKRSSYTLKSSHENVWTRNAQKCLPSPCMLTICYNFNSYKGLNVQMYRECTYMGHINIFLPMHAQLAFNKYPLQSQNICLWFSSILQYKFQEYYVQYKTTWSHIPPNSHSQASYHTPFAATLSAFDSVMKRCINWAIIFLYPSCFE